MDRYTKPLLFLPSGNLVRGNGPVDSIGEKTTAYDPTYSKIILNKT